MIPVKRRARVVLTSQTACQYPQQLFTQRQYDLQRCKIPTHFYNCSCRARTFLLHRRFVQLKMYAIGYNTNAVYGRCIDALDIQIFGKRGATISARKYVIWNSDAAMSRRNPAQPLIPPNKRIQRVTDLGNTPESNTPGRERFVSDLPLLKTGTPTSRTESR